MLYIIIGLIFAVLSLAVFPEIFGGLAMIIGAYAWRLEVAESHNRGILVILLGFVFMIAGWYVTAQYGLWDILY
jgi:membrane-bound ClpP family serine protease